MSGRAQRAYLTGLLFAGNKSATGIAARVNAHPDAIHHFVANAPWDAQELLERAAWGAYQEALRRGLKPVAYALDDTTQKKWGDSSPGVGRQFSNRYGGTVVCQSFPTLHLIFNDGHGIPVAVGLYLPSGSWDVARCEATGVPTALAGMTKPEIGIELIDQTLAAGFPKLPVLADTYFGCSGAFRQALELRGLGYLVDVHYDTSFYSIMAPRAARKDASPAKRVGPTRRADDWLGEDEPWEEQRGRQVKFQLLRPGGKALKTLYSVDEPPALHLIAENNERKKGPRYSVTNLELNDAFALLGKRWGIECNYRELKQLTGFAAYQGRSYRGLMRHLTLSAVAHIMLFWLALRSEQGESVYQACRDLPAEILLAMHEHCPLCHAPQTGFG